MSQDRETNLALFIDFDNVALGARDARQRFEIKLLLQRLLEKGKVIVKKAYADWHYYKEHMSSLHEAAIELIEIPMPRISGKNSADIKLVVDAMDLCYSKDHIDTFVIVSGDSDFSPLVSKLRENDKRVIGVGVKNSSSKLLIGNCDEFIFYEDIYRQAKGAVHRPSVEVPGEKAELFDFLLQTAQSLLQESRGVLYSSLIKDTMTRKKPDFNERAYGYSNFGDLLEDARRLGLLVVERDARAGGTWVVQGMGDGVALKEPAERSGGNGGGSSRSSRRRRRSGRGKTAESDQAEVQQDKTEDRSAGARPEAETQEAAAGTATKKTAKGTTGRRAKTTTKKAPAKKAPAKTAQEQDASTAGKKTTARKKVAKKTTKTTAKKTTKKTVKKPVTKKTATSAAKKTSRKAAPKDPARGGESS